LNELNETISAAISESKETILMGDLNINYLKRNQNIETKQAIDTFGFNPIKDGLFGGSSRMGGGALWPPPP